MEFLKLGPEIVKKQGIEFNTKMEVFKKRKGIRILNSPWIDK
jgi:hypothetical protein